MNFAALLPAPQLLAFDNIVAENGSLIILARSVQTDVRCPACQTSAIKQHSFYHRQLRDLPLAGIAVQLRLRVRKFFCPNESCPRKVFVERLTNIADVFARRTLRVTTLLQHLAFYVGGRAGAKLSYQLALQSGKDTLLRLMRRRVLPPSEVPIVLGVDDFAFRRGRTYGTILVDLERRRAIDLLPDREVKTLTTWLQEHPGIEVVSRDRSVVYAEAIRVGAPKAEQVADRWHLLKNLSEQVERVLLKHYVILRDAALASSASDASAKAEITAVTVVKAATESSQSCAIVSLAERRRRELFSDLKSLQAAGYRMRAAGRKLGIARNTVRRYWDCTEFPPRAKRRDKGSRVGKFTAYLKERWKSGECNAARLWQEIKLKGYAGGVDAVQRFVQAWRQVARPQTAVRRHRYAPRHSAKLLLVEVEKLTEIENQYVSKICEASSEIRGLQKLGQEFCRLIRERAVADFDGWLTAVRASGIAELTSWAEHLLKDEQAVRAALQSRWSNGQTEGQVNRLKNIKRQMFGRAKFDLLRARVLFKV